MNSNRRNAPAAGIALAALAAFCVLWAAAARADDELRIGVLTPLTGNVAFYGTQMWEGIRFAAKQHAGVQLFLEDSRFDSKTAISAYRKLRSTDRVQFLISMGGATCEVLNQETQRDRVIHMAVGCNTVRFDSPDSYSFRVDVNEEIAAELLAEYLRRIGVKNTAIINIRNTWGETVARFTRAAFQHAQLEIVEEISFDDASLGDLRTLLAKIKTKAPQRIFMVAPPEAAAVVLKQLRELHVESPIVSTIAIESPEVLRLAGRDAEGIVYLSVKSDQRTRERWPEYYEQLGRESFVAAWGFDAFNLLVAAWRSGRPQQWLQNLRDYVGAYNIYSYDHRGELRWPYEMRIIRNGKFETYEALKN